MALDDSARGDGTPPTLAGMLRYLEALDFQLGVPSEDVHALDLALTRDARVVRRRPPRPHRGGRR